MLFNARNEIFYDSHPVKFCFKLHKSYKHLQALMVGIEDYYMQLIVVNSYVALSIKKSIFHVLIEHMTHQRGSEYFCQSIHQSNHLRSV